MPFNFNIYSSLLLPCFLQGLLFAIIYFIQAKREQAWHHFFLSAILMLYVIYIGNWMFGFAGWYDSHDRFTVFAMYFPWTNWWLIGPLIYYYFLSLTNRQFIFTKKDLWHFLPAAFSYFIALLAFWADAFIIGEFPYHYGTVGKWGSYDVGWLGYVLRVGIYGSIFYYFIKTILLFRQYRTYLKNNFSEIDQLNFSWLRNVLYALVITQGIWLIYEIVYLVKGSGLSYMEDWYKYFLTGLLIYYISLSPFRNEPAQARKLAFEPAKSKDNDTEDKQFDAQKILSFLATSKLYLRENLTIQDLSNALGVSAAVLSKSMNNQLDKNFNQCINQFRTEEAKERLVDPSFSHLSILGIAYDCGFSSKATFNRVFKQITDQSPSDWRRSQIN